MYKGTIAASTAITAGSNIPFTTVTNSNWKTRYNQADNSVSILEQGYYNIAVSLPLTSASASPLTVQVYANDVPVTSAICIDDITSSTGSVTYTVIDCIKVAGTNYPNLAKLSVRLTGGTATTSGAGKFIVQER